ncbi:MAG: beta-mannosidase [Bacteroidales bacterium]|nr:beta-mannosidase [Bacteroidales bacterium]
MKRILFILLAAVPLCYSCKGDKPADEGKETQPVVLRLADPDATPATKALYSNLWAIREKGWMFGHQNDLVNGRSWQWEEGRSDTKEVCGDYPAVFAVDVASFMDGRTVPLQSKEDNPVKLRCMKEAYDRGMVVMACMHLNNPLTGGDSWDNSSSKVAAEILTEGSETNTLFNQWLDNLAALAGQLVGSDGVQIPVILRPFHEHMHEWSWWGSRCTTEQEYISLWRYLVDGMKARGVHTFIYAISPAMNSKQIEADFTRRWPGDEYVDFMGMDCYLGINNTVFVNNLKLLKAVSESKMKPAGVTEIGIEGFQNPDYWTNNIAAPMAGRKMSMLVTWSNKYDPFGQGKVYYSVYPGHPSEESFREMYGRPDTFFCGDLPNMYRMAENISVE